MRYVLLALALLISPANAQEKIYTFQFTAAQANIILQALGQAPYNTAAPVIAELQKQAQAADKPKIEPPPKK